MKYKKAGGWITEIGAMLLFSLIMVVFFFIFTISFDSVNFTITKKAEPIDDHVSLLNVLKTDFEYNGINKSVSELLIVNGPLMYGNPQFDSQMKSLLVDAFGKEACHVFCIEGQKIRAPNCFDKVASCGQVDTEVVTIGGQSLTIALNTNTE